MAIKKVMANLARDSTECKKTHGEYYEGTLRAPHEEGNYTAEILAYDDSGNISVANYEMVVSNWVIPKTKWKPTDRFNFVDYNRIKNNLACLHTIASRLYKPFNIADMGHDITDYLAYWDVDIFNLFEKNLDTINKNVMSQDFGQSQTFYPNGIFIQWDELNRIEGATLSIKTLLDIQESGKSKLSFRLGAFKEVKT